MQGLLDLTPPCLPGPLPVRDSVRMERRKEKRTKKAENLEAFLDCLSKD